ncbi:hypothetical protein P278_09690 [Zhouia amylolytica AD3]|uniref:Uncharacterized protein n=2 Tax=Zhouia amylolytica TaxID=376730 RepID=W2UPJ6_9FLAO|nr:hypothetical protein P278_09690 [Zhouia amylolytica AD3]
MSEYDSKWKTYYLDSLSRVDPDNAKKYEKKYDSVVSGLVENKLIPIIEKYGYPGERLTGVMVNGPLNDSYKRSYGNNYANVILIHYYTWFTKCRFNDLLMKEVIKGNLNSQSYASFIDFQARVKNSSSCNPMYYNEWHRTNDSTKFKDINKRRFKIGLSKFQEIDEKYSRGKKICKDLKQGNYNHIKLFYWCG